MPDPEDSEGFVIDHVQTQDADGILSLHTSRDSGKIFKQYDYNKMKT